MTTNKNTTTTENALNGRTWTVRPVTIRQLEGMLDRLPPVQRVRGSVWPSDVSDNLVSAVINGLYIPPVVVTITDGDIDNAALVDGQQRSLALVGAMHDGKLTGDESILLALDTARTIEDAFAALNIGVPVGTALTAAMGIGGSVGEAVVKLASHPYLSDVRWTGIQTKRTERAAFAASLLAIWMGWDAPESSAAKTSAWLSDNAAELTDDIVSDCVAYLDGMAAAIAPVVTAAAVKGKGGKDARHTLSLLRRKNYWMTACAVAAAGASPADIVAVYSREAELLDGASTEYTATNPTTGKRVKKIARWTTGAGSSGSNAEYIQRYHVMMAALKANAENPTPAKAGAEANAAADLSDTTTEAAAAALGLDVEGGC